MHPPSSAEGPARRVALDAMGGDDAPAAPVAGALLARADGVDVVLVGDEARLRPLLGEAGADDVPVVHAAEVVGMDEDPALALRSKRDASIRVAAALVADGAAAALVSAGSTGATLAAGLLAIGRLPGVRRPAVSAVLPGGTLLIDAGASPDVQPEALVAYAEMGAAHARVLGRGASRIGLLNVGAEPGKGSALARAAHDALGAVGGFVGNVEPAAVLAGAVDVVVTDGFTGNVFLKTLEAAGGTGADGPGAAILLGCARPVLVAHGDAGPEEIAAALRTARDVVAGGLCDRVAEALAGAPHDDGEHDHG
jgi:phosphate acyltransferase